MTLLNIHDALDATLTAVSNELKNRVDVKRLYGRVPPIKCYPTCLIRELVDVLLNVAQTTEGGGEITIRTWSDQTFVYVEIGPNGTEGSPAQLSLTHQPFFAAKELRDWNVFGLITAYSSSNKKGRGLNAKNRLGKRRFFLIQLPIGNADDGASNG